MQLLVVINMKYSFCLWKGCRKHKVKSRGSLPALYVDVSMAPHSYAGNNEGLWIFPPWLHLTHPGRVL